MEEEGRLGEGTRKGLTGTRPERAQPRLGELGGQRDTVSTAGGQCVRLRSAHLGVPVWTTVLWSCPLEKKGDGVSRLSGQHCLIGARATKPISDSKIA